MPKIRVVIVDHHPTVREGTRRILEQQPDIDVVGEAEDGQAALELIERLRPDVAILDIRMPGLNGVDMVRRLRTSVPSARTLVLTAHDDDEFVFALVGAGVSGYLLKTAPARDLVDAIRAVQAGEAVFHPVIARKLAELWARGLGQSAVDSEERADRMLAAEQS